MDPRGTRLRIHVVALAALFVSIWFPLTAVRTLDATLTVRFSNLGYCEPYLPPPFTLGVVRH